MTHTIPVMGDSRRKVTDEQILAVLKSGLRPVWTSSAVAEHFDITRQTAHGRLQRLAERQSQVATINVGQATAYYVPGTSAHAPGDTREERHRNSIIHWATDRFVGLPSRPWTAIHPNDGPAEGGDKIQLWIEGKPGYWSDFRRFAWDNRREKIYEQERTSGETQALISGELYEKPTTPIEHTTYPDDYDLELNIGIREVETEKGTALVAAGVKNYLIRPCNDAVFFTDVSVDWISLPDEGKEVETWSFDASGDEVEMEKIEDAVEDYHGGDEPL